MGRELKRVALDFDWPLNKVWDGYLNPFGGPCPEDGKTCFGGYTAAGKWLDAIARLIQMVAAQSRGRRGNCIWPHPYLQEWQQAPRTEIPRAVNCQIHDLQSTHERMAAVGRYLRDHPPQLLPLTAEFRELAEALAGRKIDDMNGCETSYSIAKALQKAAGMPDTWGMCPVCEGNGDDPAKRAEEEAWKKTEPPEGPGFQLWETTSEGSPVSPVFASMDELCVWAADNATTFGSFKTTAEEWRRMLDANFVCHQEGNMVFL